jgi:hypothetical protein
MQRLVDRVGDDDCGHGPSRPGKADYPWLRRNSLGVAVHRFVDDEYAHDDRP